MASSHDVLVIPHGSSVYSYHLQYAFNNCPLAEYINLSPKVSGVCGKVMCVALGNHKIRIRECGKDS